MGNDTNDGSAKHQKSAYDLLDTVVKIGLGALIGGVISFVLTQMNHHYALEVLEVQHRQEDDSNSTRMQHELLKLRTEQASIQQENDADRTNRFKLQLAQQRRELLEDAVVELVKFSTAEATFRSTLTSVVGDTEQEEAISEEQSRALLNHESAFQGAFTHIFSIEAKLILAGEPSIYDRLDVLRTTAEELYVAGSLANDELTVDKLRKTRKQLHEQRRLLLDAIGDAYRRL